MHDHSKDGSVSYWLDELKAGNELAATEIWQRYFDMLVTVARQNLKRSAARAADEEDVALSAFDSFLRGVGKGKFSQIEDRSDVVLHRALEHAGLCELFGRHTQLIQDRIEDVRVENVEGRPANRRADVEAAVGQVEVATHLGRAQQEIRIGQHLHRLGRNA
jgi:hypothetical protein